MQLLLLTITTADRTSHGRALPVGWRGKCPWFAFLTDPCCSPGMQPGWPAPGCRAQQHVRCWRTAMAAQACRRPGAHCRAARCPAPAEQLLRPLASGCCSCLLAEGGLYHQELQDSSRQPCGTHCEVWLVLVQRVRGGGVPIAVGEAGTRPRS